MIMIRLMTNRGYANTRGEHLWHSQAGNFGHLPNRAHRSLKFTRCRVCRAQVERLCLLVLPHRRVPLSTIGTQSLICRGISVFTATTLYFPHFFVSIRSKFDMETMCSAGCARLNCSHPMNAYTMSLRFYRTLTCLQWTSF
jgi:hypothetical protein